MSAAHPGVADWPGHTDVDHHDDAQVVGEGVHQTRERAVPCRMCSRRTLNFHAVCWSCHTRRLYEGTCAMCAREPEPVVWPELVGTYPGRAAAPGDAA